MKISNEQRIAFEQSEARQKTQGAAEGFDALLAETLAQGQAQGVSPLAPKSLSSLLGMVPGGMEAARELDPAKLAEIAGLSMQEAAVAIDSLFSDMEKYAGELGNAGKGNLKNAYALLEQIGSRVAEARGAFPDMENQSPELAAMLNELDVLATVERFKMNRGDYL